MNPKNSKLKVIIKSRSELESQLKKDGWVESPESHNWIKDSEKFDFCQEMFALCEKEISVSFHPHFQAWDSVEWVWKDSWLILPHESMTEKQ